MKRNVDKTFRPRFSIRTLAIFVTLICAYFASWPLTEKYGVPLTTIYDDYVGGDVIWGGSSPAPFIIQQDEIVIPPHFVSLGKSPISMWSFRNQARKRRYYFWLFGLKLRLPYESDWEHDHVRIFVQIPDLLAGQVVTPVDSDMC